MSFEIKTIENFDRQAHRLAKHYPSFREDFNTLLRNSRRIHWQGLTLAAVSEK